MVLKILGSERFDPDNFVFSRGMDEIPLPSVDPYMRDPIPVMAEEKNQVTSSQVFLRNRSAGSELVKGCPGQMQSDKVVDSHGQATAVKSLP